MKRFVSLLLIVGFLFQSFMFLEPVKALEIPKLRISGIKQGEEYLKQENGIYLIDGYDSIYLDYSVLNDNGEELYIKVVNEHAYTPVLKYPGNENNLLNLDASIRNSREFSNLTIQLCNNQNCEQVYDSQVISLQITYFEEFVEGKIYFTNLKQGDKNIYLTDGKLIINDVEDLNFTVKGENLIDDAIYSIGRTNSTEVVSFLGSELEKGVDFTINPNESNGVNLYISLGTVFRIEAGYDEKNKFYNYREFYFEKYHQSSFESKLIYTDYLDEDITLSSSNLPVLSSQYFNDDHSLSYYVKGEDYLDQDYDIIIEVIGDDIHYNIEKQVNGLLLNEGVYIELEDFSLELNETEYFSNTGNAYGYNFSIEVDGEKNISFVHYNSIGKHATFDMNIFFGNNTINLSEFAGDGSNYYTGGIYEVNQDAFIKYSSIYLNIAGENFNDDEVYHYYLEYGDIRVNYDSGELFQRQNVVKDGLVKGEILNNAEMILNYGNPQNYDAPQYNLIIKKGEEIIYSAVAVLYLRDEPTLANVALKTDSKNLYLQNIDYNMFSYIATKNVPMNLVISGLGFDEDKEYTFTVRRIENGIFEVVEKVGFTGKELNEGKAFMNYNEKIDDYVEFYEFQISCDEFEYARSSFYVTFVDSKDLFQDTEIYVVDNLKDLIKNIKKNTSVDDFISSLNIVNNGKVKIYDATGTKEVEGNVGTGMLARVMNEYEQSILDMDIVVKGDVSGDGNISVTDLVKVKRHLAKVQELDGVYEIAGNVTETGSVGITDLVKISRDVAKIEEVE